MIETLLHDQHSVRDQLRQFLPWSPHDYIRQPAGFFEQDRHLLIDQLLDPISEENDLRFIWHGPDGDLLVHLEKLAWDSQFFGYPVARLNGIFQLGPYQPEADYAGAVDMLIKRCTSAGIRYLFAVVRAEDVAALRALTGAGLALIETRLHYHGAIINYAQERYPTRLAAPTDIPNLSAAARDVVNPYDRFHADPFIDPTAADRLMEQWMVASVEHGFADGVVVPADGPATAFCTIKYLRQYWDRWGYALTQIPFGAVSDEWRGWYFKLMSEALWLLKMGGGQHCFYVTQSTNRAAIRVCEKLGFSYGRSEHVLRGVL